MMTRFARLLTIVLVALGSAPASAQDILPQTGPSPAFGPDIATPGTGLGAGGELAFGVSYGNRDGVAAMVEVAQDGVFGSDEDLRFRIEGSRFNQSLGLSLRDDDFLERPLSRTILLSGFNVAADADYGQSYSYSGVDLSVAFERRTGGGISQRAGVGLARYGIDLAANMPEAVTRHVATYGEETSVFYVFGAIDVNRAETGWMPGQGWRAVANLELGQARDTAYAKLTFGGETFHRLAAQTTLRAHADVGLSAVADGQDLPLFKTYHGGGPGSVRGFASGTLGPVSAIPGSSEVAYPGGQSAWSAGLEVARAVPATEGLKALAFYDMGNVSSDDTPFGDMRSSVGVGLTWDSPLGPLSVFAAYPLDDVPTDRTENLQVVYGVRF